MYIKQKYKKQNPNSVIGEKVIKTNYTKNYASGFYFNLIHYFKITLQ